MARVSPFIDLLQRWPAFRQLTGHSDGDPAMTDRTRSMRSRTRDADTAPSICPYCAVGCATRVHTRNGQVIDVEGDPESPINEGTLCPKGADIFQYAVNPQRLTKVLYRRPHGTEWEEVDVEWAMDRIADRFIESREETFTMEDEEGATIRNTEAIGFLGGAALDNEENYLIKKFCVGTGLVFVENQARI